MSVTKPGCSLSSLATLHPERMTLLIRRLFSWRTGTWKRSNINCAQGSVSGGKDEEQASDLPCFLTGAGNVGGNRGPPSPSLAQSTVYTECSGLSPCSQGCLALLLDPTGFFFSLVPALANQPILFHKLLGLLRIHGVCGDLSVVE